ncbi:MAG: hypothetical protein R2748_15325 [Bryobacterales bacterium]
MIYTVALTLFAASWWEWLGLKVMREGMSDRLRQSSAGGGGLRMGRV